jgi:N4-gp56 family major capsid protein
MSDVYTGTGQLLSDQEAFNRLAYFALRPELYFDQVASVRPSEQAMPGAPVTFTIYSDLAEATTVLGESTDVFAVAMSDSHVQVQLAEYGNAVLTTAKIRALSFLNVDSDAANLVGFNAGVSTDTIAREALAIGQNVVYATGGTTDPTSRGSIEAEDTLVGADIRKVVAQLRTANVPTLGGSYVGMIHPNVSYDFRAATGAANWRDPHVYSDPAGIYNGEIGMFEGVRFIETPRTKVWTGSGSGSINVYATHIVGFQALAKAHAIQDGYGPDPQIVMGPVTDKLERFRPVGWKHLVGYKVFREASVRRIESSSGLG